MSSLSEELFKIFVAFDTAPTQPSKPKLPLSEICDKVKAALRTDILHVELVEIIENSLRKYRKVKGKKSKEPLF